MAVALHGSEEALQLKEKFMAEVSGLYGVVERCGTGGGEPRLVVLGGGHGGPRSAEPWRGHLCRLAMYAMFVWCPSGWR
jgi:hypothetical protein